MMNTQDIIKAGYKNCPICNKPPLFLWDNQHNWGIGCCTTGIISHTKEEGLKIWNDYVYGKYKNVLPHGLGLRYSSSGIFHGMGCDNINAFPSFDIKKVCKYNKRTCNNDSNECWCNPKIDVYPNGNKLVIHNEDI